MRKGLGYGRGKGYFNLIPNYDSYVHSLSAKGIKVKGSMFRYDANGYPLDLPTDLGRIPTLKKKGLIKEIARKVADGVGWAVHWEMEHLPKQKEWVKKQYQKAKELAVKGKDMIKDKMEHKEEDLADVRDELDIDDDGDQDISMSQLENTNAEIRTQLEGIDLDQDSIPDYTEQSPLDLYEEYTVEEKPTLTPTIPTPKLTVKKPAKKSILKDLLPKVKTGVIEAEKFIEKETEKRKKAWEELQQYSDAQLKEQSIRQRTMGKDKYERELLRRIRKRKKVELAIQKEQTGKSTGVGIESMIPMPFQQPKNRQPTTAGTGFGEGFFGFANPLATLKR